MCNFADSGTRKKAGRPSSLGEEEAGVARGRWSPNTQHERADSGSRGGVGGVCMTHILGRVEEGTEESSDTLFCFEHVTTKEA